VRNAVITGVAGGIGSATARAFISHGWHVIGVDVKEPDEELGIHEFIIGNVATSELWQRVLSSRKITDGLDALINVAAVQLAKPIVETTEEEWETVIAVNLKSVFLSMKILLPRLVSRPASIVNVASVHALATSTNIAAYAASKGGVVSLTKAAALEFAENNVRVNAVLPGAIDTLMLEDGLSRGHLSDDVNTMKAELAQRTPCGRIGQPDEVAQTILFLADGDKSAFISGQSFVVDGGALAKLATE